MNYSVTQSSNIGVFIGLAMLILNHYKVNIAEEEVTQLVGAIVIVISTVRSWVNRQDKGDLTALGARKV